MSWKDGDMQEGILLVRNSVKISEKGTHKLASKTEEVIWPFVIKSLWGNSKEDWPWILERSWCWMTTYWWQEKQRKCCKRHGTKTYGTCAHRLVFRRNNTLGACGTFEKSFCNVLQYRLLNLNHLGECDKRQVKTSKQFWPKKKCCLVCPLECLRLIQYIAAQSPKC